uniref:Uncharacterized protein n=1 Tax=Rhizophora mucronata TaxID=61149 RepID=A0A2P2Q806_RHIMU
MHAIVTSSSTTTICMYSSNNFLLHCHTSC